MWGTILGYEFVQKNVKYFDLMKVHMLILLKTSSTRCIIYEMHHLRDTSSTGVWLMGCIVYGINYLWKAQKFRFVSINCKMSTYFSKNRT